MLPNEIAIVTDLFAAHHPDTIGRASTRATHFGRFRRVDVRSI